MKKALLGLLLLTGGFACTSFVSAAVIEAPL